MDLLNVAVRNFKGAKHLVIAFDSAPRSNIFPLVGLNESGKSTLLEALSLCGSEYIDFSKEDPSGGVLGPDDFARFLPVAEKHNFNGKISITSTFRLSEKDRTLIINFIKKTWGYEVISFDQTISIERFFIYKDSIFSKQGTTWSVNPTVKKHRGRTAFLISGDDWQTLIRYVRTLVPKVLFFRNELFDIPDKIFLGNTASDEAGATNAFYRDVIQDVLFATDAKLNVKDHILARCKSKNPSDRESLDLVLERMSSHMTWTVMHQWENIFGRKLNGKSIRVVFGIDETERCYLQIRLVDGAELFNINQRSTGFRWFFVFILLTQYRGYRNESAIFLYDEPASNLHSSAQQQLLNCFSKLPQQFNIIYSTHSHYLIRPEWLDSTFVVQNEAADDSKDLENLYAAKTDIKVAKYRQFVSENPNGLSYFQPILDVLQYVPSRFDFVKPAVLMEGKSDFYLMSYMADVQLKITRDFDIMPCGGSGTVDQLITLYAGWGREFVVLLDSDNEGQKAKARYIEKFGPLVTGRIIVYADIDPSWARAGLEKITGESDMSKLCTDVFSDSPPNKKNFALAVQELLTLKRKSELTGESEANFSKIFSYLKNLLNGPSDLI